MQVVQYGHPQDLHACAAGAAGIVRNNQQLIDHAGGNEVILSTLDKQASKSKIRQSYTFFTSLCCFCV